MAEADAVERTARRLDRLAGRELTGCDLRWPSLATVDLTGRLLVGTARMGKHLLTRFGADGRRPAVTLHSHLRMEGSWRVLPAAGARPLRHTVRAVLTAADLIAVGDRLGLLALVRTDAEATLVGHLGPDILAPQLDPGAVAATVRASPAPVGATLLDQRVLAGLGTVWVSEGLHAGGINPWAVGGDVDLVALTAALAALPARIRDSIEGAAREPRVYGRRHRPCPRCGAPIRRDPVGRQPRRRELFWCPGCQRP